MYQPTPLLAAAHQQSTFKAFSDQRDGDATLAVQHNASYAFESSHSGSRLGSRIDNSWGAKTGEGAHVVCCRLLVPLLPIWLPKGMCAT